MVLLTNGGLYVCDRKALAAGVVAVHSQEYALLRSAQATIRAATSLKRKKHFSPDLSPDMYRVRAWLFRSSM
jgi:hypothetical protein